MMVKAESGGFWRVKSMPYLTDRAPGSLRVPERGCLPAVRTHVKRTHPEREHPEREQSNGERGRPKHGHMDRKEGGLSVGPDIFSQNLAVCGQPSPKTFTQPRGKWSDS